MAETRYRAFDDDAPEREVPEETSEREASDEAPKKRKKEKLDKEGSKKNKKAKGVKRLLKWLVPITAGLAVAASLFSVRTSERDARDKNGSCLMAVYTPRDQQPDAYYVDDYYVYSENGTNYLVRFDKNIDGAYSVLDSAVIEGIDKDAVGVTPLEETQLFEQIVESSKIEGQSKGMSDDINTYVVYADGLKVVKYLSAEDCLSTSSSYEYDGESYGDVVEYLGAVYEAKEEAKSK